MSWTVAATTAFTSMALLVAPAPPAFAADACLEPLPVEVGVSQGLPSYDKLVRGKTTLFKAFLTEKPSSGGCSAIKAASVYVTGGAVTINNGTASTPLVVPGGTNLPALPVGGTTIAPNSPADPVFAIPGDRLVPAGTASTLSFTARIDYVTRSDSTGLALQSGSITVSSAPGTTTPITKNLAPATRPLRLLAVPLGDVNSTVPQFPSEAQSTLQNAMLAASRIEPVADGVGDILGTTGGVRYAVAAGTVNLGVHDEVLADGSTRTVNYMPSGTFCGTATSFTYIRQKLSDFRAAWNAEHPTAPADRVLGVIAQGISDGPSTNPNSGCSEGYAAINSPEAWVRLTEPATGSPSGGVAALELEHTLGGVVGAVGYHSSNSAADGTAVGRAFNTTTLRQIPAPRSAMRFDVTGWDNYTTLFEKRDWDFTLCMLASTASPATECGSGTSGGTSAPASGGFVLSGLTDLTKVGTDAHTRYDADPPADGQDPTSGLRLGLIDVSNALISHIGVRAYNLDSSHDDTEQGEAAATEPRYGFDVAIPAGKAAAFELWKGTPRGTGSVLLYRRDLNAAPLVGDPVLRAGASAASRFTTDGTSSAPSASGTLVAVARGGQVVLSSTTSPAPLASVPGQSGRLSEDGSTLVVTNNGDVTTYPVTRTATGASLGAAKAIYTGGGLLAPGAASSPVLVGSTAVFTAAGDLYAVNTTSGLLPVSSTLCGVGDALPLALPGNPCSRWTATAAAVERAGSWSSTRGLLAYTSTTAGAPSVWTLDPANPTATATSRIAGVSDPAWAAGLLLVAGPTGLLAYDGTSFAVPSRITSAPGDTAPTVTGNRVFFTRPSGASTDVWTLALDRTTVLFTASDETPAFLRTDVYVDCGTGLDPVLTALRPTAVTPTSATTDATFQTDRTCATPDVVLDVTDGYSVTQKRLTSPIPGGRLPSAAIYSPQDGSTALAFNPFVIAGEATGSFVYSLTGPAGSGYSDTVVGSGSPKVTVQPPTGGFAPGLWTVKLSTSGVDGTYTTLARVTVLSDSDGDGIPDVDDTQAKYPCYPVDAVTNSINASTDYDGDLLISLVDPQPCTSSLNAVIDFDANSINIASSGKDVTVYVTSSAFDLRQLTAANTKIVQFGSYPVSQVATSVIPSSATTATLKFSRQDLQNLYLQYGTTGYIPILISGSNPAGTASFRGYDGDAPSFSP